MSPTGSEIHEWRPLRARRYGNSGQVNKAMEPTVLVELAASVSLQTITKAEAVYLETRSRILKGTLAPGSAVNQEALAADLGVSITPLREALRRLEMEGLIHLEAHRTMSIAPLTSRELDEMYAVRMELDPFAAGLAASNVSDAQMEVIYRLANQKAAHDPVLQLERNRGFHRAVYSCVETTRSSTCWSSCGIEPIVIA